MIVFSDLKRNFSYAFLAQLTSLFVSCYMAFVVPKFISIVDYSYWQLFIFYNTLIIFLNFGYNQGIYLKNGGIDYRGIEGLNLAAHFKIIFFMQFFLSLIVCFFAFENNDVDKKIIYICIAVASIINNLSDFFCYFFQTINKIKEYSRVIVGYNLCYLLLLTFLFIIGNILNITFGYKECIILYVFSRIIGLLIGILNSFRILKLGYTIHKNLNIKVLFDGFNYMKIGLLLSASELVSFLVLGINRLCIENMWGIYSFGLVSFTLQLSNFVVAFLKQIGLVLFPHLRRLEEIENKEIYTSLTNFFDLYGMLLFVLYVPIRMFVLLWLPEYERACEYLIILMPICLFEARMQLLGVTFFKIFRMESILLKINIIVLIIACILAFFFTYCISNLNFLIYCMLFCVVIRSMISELILNNYFSIKNKIGSIILILFTIIFCIVFEKYDYLTAGIIYLISCVIYIIGINVLKHKFEFN